MKPFSLYIHIPYCLQKCPYCDFNTYAVSNLPEDEYVTALLAELDFYAVQAEWRDRPIQTVYFGGGTPSLLAPQSFERFFQFLKERHDLMKDCEVTMEANPGNLDRENLQGFFDAGINRLSLGSQSFTPHILERLGRLHTPEQIQNSVELARSVGFENISLDLIFGVPDQTLDLLRSDIEQAVSLSPDHISAYSLTYEKGTPFFQAKAKGTLKAIPDDTVGEMMQLLIDSLTSREFRHYEVSNFGKSGKESQHNLAYWNRDDYLGLGAGAHSYLRKGREEALRWSNYALPKEYIEHSYTFGKSSSWQDTLQKKELMFEFFFLGMRRMQGVRRSDFESEFNEDLDKRFGQKLHDLIEESFIEENNQVIRFSSKGLLVGDSILEHFVL